MLDNGFIDQAQYAAADAEPLGTVRQRLRKFDSVGGYFIEAVRRELIDRFGEKPEDGPHSVYAGARKSVAKGQSECVRREIGGSRRIKKKKKRKEIGEQRTL